MVPGSKWQPTGCQYAYACRVCANEGSDECSACLMERHTGFEFDPRKYIKMCNEYTNGWHEGNKNWCIGGMRGSGKIFHLEQMLARVTEDRDYWRHLAESAIQRIKEMAEREIE